MGFFDFLGAVKHEEPLRHRRIRRDSSVRTMEAVYVSGTMKIAKPIIMNIAMPRSIKR